MTDPVRRDDGLPSGQFGGALAAGERGSVLALAHALLGPLLRHSKAMAPPVVFLAAALGISLAFRASSFPAARQESRVETASRETPFSVTPTFSEPLDLPATELPLDEQVPPPKKELITVPDVLHLLHAHGLEARFHDSDFQSGGELLSLLTNQAVGRSCFHEPAFVRTRYGLRFVTRGEGPGQPYFEAHRDQCLAAFGELGLPLSTPLVLETTGEGALRDVLADSLANFDIHQSEPAWTAIAYSLYLPPMRRWKNRYGEEYSFDDLAAALLNCPLDQTSCGGTHQLHALVVMARVDQEAPFLSPDRRRSIDTFLSRAAADIVRSQEADGAWGSDWCRRSSLNADAALVRPASDADGRLIITSHLCEVLLILPARYHLPGTVMRRAVAWLSARLAATPIKEQSARTCPLAHVLAVLKVVQRRGIGSGRPHLGDSVATKGAL